MTVRGGRKIGRLRAAALILSGIFAVRAFSLDGRIFCEAKEAGTKQGKAADAEKGREKAAEGDAAQEVIDFVIAYYEAQTPDGIDTLADYVDDPLSEDFQRDLLRQQITFREGGIQGWENIKVIVLPMSDGKHWIVSASSDLRVEAFDVGIPGLRVELVGRNEEGALKIIKYDDSESSDAFLKEMRKLALSDEIVEHSNETAMAYNELIAERSDIREWALTINETVNRELGKALAREDALLVKADSDEEDQEEKPDGRKGSYTVQKGDCLWDIAERQFGDGMRWSGLYEQNKDVIGEDPDLLYVGVTLQFN